MNVAFFTDTYFPQINGVVTSVESFRTGLEALGHNVFIFAPRVRGYKDPKELKNKVFRLERADTSPRMTIHQKEFPYELPRVEIPNHIQVTGPRLLRVGVFAFA